LRQHFKAIQSKCSACLHDPKVLLFISNMLLSLFTDMPFALQVLALSIAFLLPFSLLILIFNALFLLFWLSSLLLYLILFIIYLQNLL
jgi:hypothetical protein